jgi:toxoflavin biosynthesis protein ToxD
VDLAAICPDGWVQIPDGLVHRGTPYAQVHPIAVAHADLGVPEGWISKEVPRRVEAVPSFTIALTPVRLDVWRQFAAGEPLGWQDEGRPGDHPVDGVTWPEAERFCQWVSRNSTSAVRFPTEQDWERAARGDDVREYPWGATYERGYANLADLRLGRTTPVGSFPAGASPFGLLDMAGNVDEWTSTIYAPYPGAPDGVPATEDWATDHHITRGGGYEQDRDLARCARRHAVYPPFRGAGLRLVLVAP